MTIKLSERDLRLIAATINGVAKHHRCDAADFFERGGDSKVAKARGAAMLAVLKAFPRLTITKIAEIFNCSWSTVKIRLAEAKLADRPVLRETRFLAEPADTVNLNRKPRTEPMRPLGSLLSPRQSRPGFDVTAALMGDPPAGQSALDKRNKLEGGAG